MASNDRLSQFKNRGRDLESSRNRRKEDVTELRKARKDEQLSKRRNFRPLDNDSDFEEPENNNPSSPVSGRPLLNQDIDKLVRGLFSNDPKEIYQCAHNSRKVLSKEKNPPIDKFITLNAVPRFVELLAHDENPELQFEAAWALTNIASGNSSQTQCIVDAEACPQFLRLLGSPAQNVAEQAIWALANIAGEGSKYRDMLINLGVIPAITRWVQPDISHSFLANIAWCFSNLCRNKNPPPPMAAIQEMLPVIKQLLLHNSSHVMPDACWSLSYISDGSDDRIQEVVNVGVIDRLVEIMKSSTDRNLVVPAMRTIGNIVTGTDEQTQAIIDHGALDAFRAVLDDPKLNLRKEIAWALSNITAGNKKQIQAVIDSGLLRSLVDILKCSDYKVQKEAAWAICNLTCSGTVEQIAYFLQLGGLPTLVEMLKQQDAKMVQVLLDAFKNILKAAESMNQKEALCDHLEELGFVDHLEDLQQHENAEIYELAVKLVEDYWDTEDATGLEAATNDDGSQYDFNAEVHGNPNIRF